MPVDANDYYSRGPLYNGYGDPDLAPTGNEPLLLPNIGPVLLGNAEQGGGSFAQNVSVDQFLAAFPRIPATAQIVLTGTDTAGDTCAISIFNDVLPNGGKVTVSTIVAASDDLTGIAERLVAKINADPVLIFYGLTASVGLSGADPAINLVWPGPVGNFSTAVSWSFANLSSATIGGSVTASDVTTLTTTADLGSNCAQLTLSGTLAEDDELTITFSNTAFGVHAVTYTVPSTPVAATVAAAIVTALNADTTLDLIGFTSSSNGSKISLRWNTSAGSVNVATSAYRAATEELTITLEQGSAPSALAPAPTGQYTVEVGGTATEDDVVSLTVFASAFSPPVTVSYEVQSGDTVDDIATGLADVINDNPRLAGGGFAADTDTATVTITWNMQLCGQVTITGEATAIASEYLALTGDVAAVALSYTSAGGNTTTTIATALKNAVNADVILNQYVFASSSGAIVSLFWNSQISAVFTGAVSGGATETITIAALNPNTITIGGTATTGDSLYARFTSGQFEDGAHTVSAAVTTGDSTTVMASALKTAINNDDVCRQNGITATSSGAIVTVLVDGDYPVPVIAGWSNGVAKTATIGGTITVGDVINIVVTCTEVDNSPVTVQYQTVSGDTTLTLLATHLAAAISADTDLAAAGFEATSNLAVVSITWPETIAASVSFARSVNGTTTATISGTPTPTEVPRITITDANVVGTPLNIDYTVQVADDNDLIAAGFAALINGSTALSDAGITATSAGAVVSIVSESLVQTTVARTNSANTSIALAAGPTETVTLAGAPTETVAISQAGIGSEVLTPTAELSGGSGAVLANKTFPMSFTNPADGANTAGVAAQWRKDQPQDIDFATLEVLVAQAAPIR